MASIPKAVREQVRQMFDGRCAYCGCELPPRWHVDHVEPALRALRIEQTNRGYRFVSGPSTRPERHVIENFMPSCPPCNIDKHAMSLENWRGKLARTLEVLNRNYPTYRHARRFGMLQETSAAVVFYFERDTGVKEA